MGVIKRQSLKFTIVNFIGTFIGFLSVILIYPLHKETYGLFQFLYNSATLLLPFLGLGIYGFILRYGPEFEKKGLKSYLLSFSLKIVAISTFFMTFVIGLVGFLFQNKLKGFFPNFDLISTNIGWIYLLALNVLALTVLIAVSTSYLRIVIPDLLNTLLLKLVLPIVVLLVYYNVMKMDDVKWFFPVYFFIIAVIVFFYVLRLDSHKWGSVFDRFSRSDYREMTTYMGFVFLNGLGVSLALKVDVSMIGALISVGAVSSFAIVMTISNVIDIPTKALSSIASPIISSSWANGDTQNIQMIYRKSSLYGEIIGVFLFLLIYSIWSDIVAIMPGDKSGLTVELARNLFLFLGLSRLINISTGVNSLIIVFSKDYKFQMYFLLLLGAVNVVLNYILIQDYGITGAAAATFLSLLLFNLSQNAFVYVKYGFGLDILSMVKVLIIGTLLFVVLYFLHLTLHPLINMGIKGIVIVLIYIPTIWMVNPGGELRLEAIQTLTKTKGKIPVFFHPLIDKIIKP